MPVLPSLGPTTATSRLAIRATEPSRASASASASETNYVSYTHKYIHGSKVWHWDGRSGINLIFIVAFLCGLVLVFIGLILLSRLLARTNAPRSDETLGVPFRRPTSVPITMVHAPVHMMAQVLPRSVVAHPRSPFDHEVRKSSTLADQKSSSLATLPSAPPLRHQHSLGSTPNASAASSSQNVVTPLLTSSYPLGSNRRGNNERAISRGEGPPPALKDPKRQSRYGSALSRSTSKSSSSSTGNNSFSDPLPSPATEDQPVRRVQSIGRGNSLRYSAHRSHAPNEDPDQAEVGRSNSARLAQQAQSCHRTGRSFRSVRGPRRMSSAKVNDVPPYRDLSPSTQPIISADYPALDDPYPPPSY